MLNLKQRFSHPTLSTNAQTPLDVSDLVAPKMMNSQNSTNLWSRWIYFHTRADYDGRANTMTVVSAPLAPFPYQKRHTKLANLRRRKCQRTGSKEAEG